MGKFDNFCQSCGMPMDKDPGHGGTNADGSTSSFFCSYCYENGTFKDQFTSPKEMILFVRNKLKENGLGPIRRWFFTSHIHQLKRWKNI